MATISAAKKPTPNKTAKRTAPRVFLPGCGSFCMVPARPFVSIRVQRYRVISRCTRSRSTFAIHCAQLILTGNPRAPLSSLIPVGAPRTQHSSLTRCRRSRPSARCDHALRAAGTHGFHVRPYAARISIRVCCSRFPHHRPSVTNLRPSAAARAKSSRNTVS